MAELRDHSLEELVEQVQALPALATDDQVRSVARLGARCTIEISDSLRQLSGVMHGAKASLVGRMDTMGGHLQELESAISEASEKASEQTESLVTWTKVLAACTAMYTLITAGLLIASVLSLPG